MSARARINVQIPYRRSGRPLILLIDIEPWERHWSERPWRGGSSVAMANGRPASMAHRVAGNGGGSISSWTRETGDIRAVEFTSSRQGDSPLLPDLLAQIPEGEEIATVAVTVTADGADDTRRYHEAIIEHGADAVILIRRNGRAWKENCPAAVARNKILRATRHLGRVLWKKWAGLPCPKSGRGADEPPEAFR